jgi:phage-related protein
VSAKLECRFYRDTSGEEPVREWLRRLPATVRKEIGSDVLKIQWRWPVSRPLVGAFGRGLYEVRTSLDGTIYRVFFAIVGSTMVLLHAFVKKTQKTPKGDIDIARRRQKEVEA